MTTSRLLVGLAAAVFASTLSSVAMAATAVTISNVNLREGPSTDYPIIATLPANTAVEVEGCASDWCKVDYAGSSGWMAEDYLQGLANPPVIVLPPPLAVLGGLLHHHLRPGHHYRPPGGRPPHGRPPHGRPPHVLARLMSAHLSSGRGHRWCVRPIRVRPSPVHRIRGRRGFTRRAATGHSLRRIVRRAAVDGRTQAADGLNPAEASSKPAPAAR
jgi:Bacterial SH3 domain